MSSPLMAALKDVADGVRLTPLWWRLGLDQTVSRFQRSVLGPFWMACNLLVIAFALTIVVSALMGVDMSKSFPLVLAGLLAWSLVGTTIAEAQAIFLYNAGLMQSQRLPLTFYVFLHAQKAATNFLTQLIAFWVVMLLLQKFVVPHWTLIPAVALVLLLVCFQGFIIAIPSTRFRDVAYMMSYVVQLLFYVTPVFWAADNISPKWRKMVELNPLTHQVELLRAPLLGHAPAANEWIWVLGTTGVLALVALTLLAMFRKRVVFWL
ncbi:ABC transporter permease [Caulobacter sp. BP25]|uniref:ABC transporter permease n=1 Tax=Caulobacter sp. BP25 TaxID=2048900 RepID=UPI000C12C0C3|nr:ABC transporter permease [Caulobacter sp. BP25]PHY18829.1 ABC transporter [Caulobacter sp. BP25]